MNFEDRVAIVTGASRGIGKELAVGLAREGCHVVVAAKTAVATDPRLPGTIHDTAAEVEALGRRALPVQVDLRDGERVEAMVAAAVQTFGRVDFLVNNAGALYWRNVEETATKRYDLVHGVNARASFIAARECIPHMKKQGFGHILNMSPPFDLSLAPGKVAYAISKLGMTLIAVGLAGELGGTGVACNTLWPETLVDSFAVRNWNLGDPAQWRKPQIIVDAALEVFSRDPKTFTGHQLLDETFLREQCGVTDFTPYRNDPDTAPLRLDAGWNAVAGKQD